MKFERRARASGSRARTGVVTTLHNQIETPIFMPVGTRASVRTQTLAQLAEIGAPIILGNTYHLMIRPGIEVFERMGGLHKWMGWNKSILTDSGGFQIFSLPHARSMGEDGAAFRSYVDGTMFLLTPERSIAMQRAIGSDIMMVLDQCIDSTSPHAVAREAMELTHRWARRSLAAREGSPQALFAIVQGACFEDLRRQSADVLTSIDGFDGYAIGGLAVGEGKAQREDICELAASLLPDDKPRYLMGVGTPLDLLEAVHRGVDMFDCIIPTAWAQQGVVFTSGGKVDLKRGGYKFAEESLDPTCSCDACRLYSRSYLHHLMKCEEPLGWQLLAFHNLKFYADLMRKIRGHIEADTFAAFHAEARQTLALVDQGAPRGPAPRVRKGRATTRGNFTVHKSPQGFASIQHVASGEIMHSVNDPNVEAEQIYVRQSVRIAEALAGGERELVVWDVGLGAAHNAMALVRALDAAPGHAPVRMISFEHDLDAFLLALSLQKEFVHLRHPAPHILANAKVVERGRLRWELCEGSFLDHVAAQPAPDVVWWDPFSSKVDTAMWSLATFRQVFAALAGARASTELFTYSTSTAVRSAMLAAGFWVGAGVGSGPKSETTIAVRRIDDEPTQHLMLGKAWLERRSRSTAKFGADVAAEDQAAVERAILEHPQFR